MKDNKEYARLPGRGLKGGGLGLFVRTRARLYAGEDHLLCIYNTGYTEDYKRFYFKDIGAIVACKTARGRNWSIFFCVIALLFALLAFTSKDFWTTDSLKIAGLFFLLLLINYLRGPTCKAYLRTAVSEEELPSLSRMRQALKALDRLRSSIEDSQGRLTSEEIGAKSAELPGKALPALRQSISAAAVVRQTQNYSGRAHEILFYLLLAGGALTLSEFFLNSIALTLLDMLIGSALIVLGIVSVVKQHTNNMKGGLIGITWASLCYLFFGFIVSYFIYIFIAIKNPGVGNNQWELLRLYSTISPFDNPFLEWFYIVSIVFYLTAGLSGLVLLRKYRSERQLTKISERA